MGLAVEESTSALSSSHSAGGQRAVARNEREESVATDGQGICVQKREKKEKKGRRIPTKVY